MGEELERRHNFVVGVFVTEVDVVNFLEGVEDENTAFLLRFLDAVLVFEASVPKRLELLLLPLFGISRDWWVIIVEGGVVLVEQDFHPGLILVGCIGKDKAGDFSIFRAGEANRETCL